MVFVRQLGDGDVRQKQVQFDLVDGMAVDDLEGTLARFLLDDFREVLLQTDGVRNCGSFFKGGYGNHTGKVRSISRI